MSHEPLLDVPAGLDFDETATGFTVRSGMMRATDVNVIALGRPCKHGLAQQVGNGGVYDVGYVRTHTGITQLYASWYYRAVTGSGFIGSTISVSLAITDAAGNTVINTNALVPTSFKAGNVITGTLGSTLPLDAITFGGDGSFDLASLAAVLVDPSWHFQFTVTTDGVTSIHLDRIELWEMPRTVVYDTDDMGALTGPLNPGNPVDAGSATPTLGGWSGLARTIEGAIVTNRAYVNLVWPRNIAAAIPQTASALFLALTNFEEGAGSGTPVPLKFRPRPILYVTPPGNVAGESARFRVLYWSTTAASVGVVRCATGATGSPYDTANLVTIGAWTWSPWKTIAVATNGANNIETISFQAKVSAGTLYVAAIQVEEFVT